MRRRNKHLARNAVQNAVILLLIANALFLIFCTGLVRPDSFDRVLRTVSSPAGDQTGDAPSAALPLHVAVRSGGQCRVWMNETTDGDLFEDPGSLPIEALGSAQDGAAVSEAEFRRALENDAVYYDFTVSLPLRILTGWIGSTETDFQHSARALLLSGLQSDTLTLYAWDGTSSSYYRWSTAIPSGDLLTNTDKYTGSAAEFAFLCDAPYDTLAPYTFVFSDRLVLADLSASAALDESAKSSIMTALDFNIHSSSSYYTESNGAEVISQGSRTLRFSPDGSVAYSGGAEDVPLLQLEQSGETPTLAECSSAALNAANTLTGGRLGSAALYLSSAEADQRGNATVAFDYTVNGYPVVFPNRHAVEITIENGVITSISIQMRTYTALETTTALMPALQAGPGREFVETYCPANYRYEGLRTAGQHCTVTASAQVDGLPVYGATIVFSFTDDLLTSASGFFVPASELSSEPIETISRASAAVYLMDHCNEEGKICNTISGISDGYLLQSTVSAPMMLVPAYRIDTNTYSYYVNSSTGHVTPAGSSAR